MKSISMGKRKDGLYILAAEEEEKHPSKACVSTTHSVDLCTYIRLGHPSVAIYNLIRKQNSFIPMLNNLFGNECSTSKFTRLPFPTSSFKNRFIEKIQKNPHIMDTNNL